MLRTTIGVMLFMATLPLPGTAQLGIHGQGSVAFINSEDGESQYVYNGGMSTFAWRGDLFASALIASDLSLQSNIRIQQDGVLHIDYFSLRMTSIATSALNAEAGLIDLPFGNLGDRRFPAQNPFYGLPLMNEHLTSLCASDYRNWVLVPELAMNGNGVRLLDQGLYDLGVKVFGTIGMLEYAAAVTNGMVSATSTYSKNGLNPNSGFGKMVRLGVTPMTGLTIGASYAAGPFLHDQSLDTNSSLYGEDPRDYPQEIVMADVDFSDGYFTFYGQAGYNTWKFGKEADAEEEVRGKIHEDLNAFAWSAEGSYAVTPRLSLSARAGGLVFNEITDSVPSYGGLVAYSGTWDHNVFRLESSVRYHLTRELVIKAVYVWNRTYGVAEDPKDNALIVQTVVSF